jgi:PCRF domain
MVWSLACHARNRRDRYPSSSPDFLGGSMKRVIEIRSAEGGEDSKLFVKDLAQAYLRMFQREGWDG